MVHPDRPQNLYPRKFDWPISIARCDFWDAVHLRNPDTVICWAITALRGDSCFTEREFTRPISYSFMKESYEPAVLSLDFLRLTVTMLQHIIKHVLSSVTRSKTTKLLASWGPYRCFLSALYLRPESGKLGLDGVANVLRHGWIALLPI